MSTPAPGQHLPKPVTRIRSRKSQIIKAKGHLRLGKAYKGQQKKPSRCWLPPSLFCNVFSPFFFYFFTNVSRNRRFCIVYVFTVVFLHFFVLVYLKFLLKAFTLVPNAVMSCSRRGPNMSTVRLKIKNVLLNTISMSFLQYLWAECVDQSDILNLN